MCEVTLVRVKRWLTLTSPLHLTIFWMSIKCQEIRWGTFVQKDDMKEKRAAIFHHLESAWVLVLWLTISPGAHYKTLGLRAQLKNVFCKRDLEGSNGERRERRMLYKCAENSPRPVISKLWWAEIPWGTSSPPALGFHSLPSPPHKDLPLIDMETTVAFSERHTLGGIL